MQLIRSKKRVKQELHIAYFLEIYFVLTKQVKQILSLMELITLQKQIAKTSKDQISYCSKCFQFHPRILQTECACQKFLCRDCLSSMSRTQEKVCSFCSLPIVIVKPSSISISYHCLSNSPKCAKILESEQAFLNHCKTCPFISEDSRLDHQHYIRNECIRGHALRCLQYSGNCTICNEVNGYFWCKVCAWNQCPSKYCRNCRPIPCNKQQSAFGPIFKNKMTAICGICGIDTSFISQYCYTNQNNNNEGFDWTFSVCLLCYQDLPSPNQ